MKKTYLLVYDYGMGGIWSIMTARSEEEIKLKYPELYVYEEKPSWMDDQFYEHLRLVRCYDIDDKAYGWLESFVAERDRK